MAAIMGGPRELKTKKMVTAEYVQIMPDGSLAERRDVIDIIDYSEWGRKHSLYLQTRRDSAAKKRNSVLSESPAELQPPAMSSPRRTIERMERQIPAIPIQSPLRSRPHDGILTSSLPVVDQYFNLLRTSAAIFDCCNLGDVGDDEIVLSGIWAVALYRVKDDIVVLQV